MIPIGRIRSCHRESRDIAASRQSRVIVCQFGQMPRNANISVAEEGRRVPKWSPTVQVCLCVVSDLLAAHRNSVSAWIAGTLAALRRSRAPAVKSARWYNCSKRHQMPPVRDGRCHANSRGFHKPIPCPSCEAQAVASLPLLVAPLLARNAVRRLDETVSRKRISCSSHPVGHGGVDLPDHPL